MMKNFQIKICPLCQATLKLSYSVYKQVYCCPTHFDGDGISPTHYEVIVEGSIITQKTRLYPYLIVNKKGSGRSEIFSMKNPLYDNLNNSGSFIMEIPMIVPEDPEKMKKKIRVLIPFS